MRRVLISLAAAGAALAVASPAAAQYYPSQPYGYGYGYNDYGQVRALHARIDRIERQIDRLDRYGAAPAGVADRLRDQARRLEYRLSVAARNGLNPYEASEIQARVGQLDQRVQYFSANRYGYRGYNDGYGDRGYGYQEGRGHWNGDRNRDEDDDHERN